MVELTKYFSVRELELTWELSSKIEFSKGVDPDNAPIVKAFGPARRIVESNISEMDRRIVLSCFKILGEFQKQGPVIIRPSLNLCNALIDTELNIPTLSYHQPFKVMGVELPKEVIGEHAPALALVYQMFQGDIVVWYHNLKDSCTYHMQVGADLRTIEERLNRAEWTDVKEEAQLFHRGCRVALNCALLAATRKTEITSLPHNVVRRRNRRQDPRACRLAARQCQEIIFRDLVVYERGSSKNLQGTPGVPQGKQHRRGHWKNVACGPQHSQRKLQWINDYYTHAEIESDPVTLILK